MADIFISYAKEDRTKAETIAGALEQRGWSVWWDREIPPGKRFDDVIEEELRLAQCVVVLWSESSVSSDWVRAEADEGAKRKILVPALLSEVEAPFAFTRIQAADLIGWGDQEPHYGFGALLKAIKKITSKSDDVKAPSGDRAIPAATPADRTQEQWRAEDRDNHS